MDKRLDENGDPYKLDFEEVTELEAGKPYLFVPEADALRVVYKESTQVLTADHFNGMYGTFENIIDGAAGAQGNILETNYLVVNNMFRICGGYCSLPANRAYIQMGEVAQQGSPIAPAPVPGRRRMSIGKNDAPQITTAIDEQMVHDQMVNGQWYDILGRPVDINNAAHGVYIINGQKVVK